MRFTRPHPDQPAKPNNQPPAVSFLGGRPPAHPSPPQLIDCLTAASPPPRARARCPLPIPRPSPQRRAPRSHPGLQRARSNGAPAQVGCLCLLASPPVGASVLLVHGRAAVCVRLRETRVHVGLFPHIGIHTCAPVCADTSVRPHSCLPWRAPASVSMCVRTGMSMRVRLGMWLCVWKFVFSYLHTACMGV